MIRYFNIKTSNSSSQIISHLRLRLEESKKTFPVSKKAKQRRFQGGNYNISLFKMQKFLLAVVLLYSVGYAAAGTCTNTSKKPTLTTGQTCKTINVDDCEF